MYKIPSETNVFGRFLLSGGFNTLSTYLLYLLLLTVLSYQVSYTISYISGVVLSYFLNRLFVFKTHQGLRSVFLFPLVYVIQYLSTSLVLWLLVDNIGVDSRVALPVAIVMFVPVNYFLSRKIFSDKK
ncbi:GtrA family protein [Pseudomonas sp. NPDC096950]|uniref:GtrA family protein n=1 Tax=Pseudomonas sp. NPDC096950 TaxID=3364485 RepID=UPI00383BBDC8